MTPVAQFMAMLPDAVRATTRLDVTEDETIIEWRQGSKGFIVDFNGVPNDVEIGYAIYNGNKFMPGAYDCGVHSLPPDLAALFVDHTAD